MLVFYSFISNNKYIFFDKKFIEYNEFKNTKNNWEKCFFSKIVDFNFCKIGTYNNKVFLIGDSIMITLMNDLVKRLNKKKYELFNLAGTNSLYRGDHRDKRTIFLKNIKNSIFIFGGYYQRESESELSRIYNQLEQNFDLFLKNNNTIIFLSPIPETPFNRDKDFFLLFKNKKKNISVLKEDIINKNKIVVSLINKFKDISIIDLKRAFCDDTKCYAVNDKKYFKSKYIPSFLGRIFAY